MELTESQLRDVVKLSKEGECKARRCSKKCMWRDVKEDGLVHCKLLSLFETHLGIVNSYSHHQVVYLSRAIIKAMLL